MDNIIDQLREKLEIDKFSLDDEIVNQPTFLFQVSEALSEAIAERDACKEELASVDAGLDGKIRADFIKAKIKYTEPMVKNEVQLEKAHSDAFDTYILAKTRADKLLALKEGFQARGYMLRDLASLYVANYFDSSSVQGTAKTERAAYNQQREQLANARKRGRLDD